MKNYYLAFLLLVSVGINAQKMITKKEFRKDSVYISLENPFLAPVEFNIVLIDSLKNRVRYKKSLLFSPKEIVKDVFVVPLSIIKDTAAINVNNYASIKGKLGNSKTTKHDADYAYTLPYKKGKSYKIMQSFGGKFSHYRKHSKYAIDFSMQIGDTIMAARGGIVIIVKEDSKEHGRTYEYADKGNRIIIMHNDGTFGDYVHLDFNGSLVDVGDTIKVGQPIGISGLTGFTTKPHLHFVVLEPGSKSVPMYFKGIGRKKLKPGKRYKRRQ